MCIRTPEGLKSAFAALRAYNPLQQQKLAAQTNAQ